ncbi:MAG TPA: lipopolysaccharide heptosyltransferase family protein [Candidatus Aquabacterium excrementipullorum]|nr:lipopolysaccharide heptosyltransferase family protein [Candidatus Aquabacterium excrementipullorum]
MNAILTDRRPRTVVLHQFTGIGDLIWHVQYFKAVAQQSAQGKVTVIAQPSTMARAILGHEPWVDAIIDHDHRPRRHDGRKGAHSGLRGMWRMAQSLKAGGFDRIILFSGRPSRGLLAAMSGIPNRLGYGYHWLQRCFLTQGPYIPRYKGPAVAVLKEVSAFAIAHGFCEAPLVPRIDVPEQELALMSARLEGLPPVRIALAVGTSEPHKQWGADRFGTLARQLTEAGRGVVILGGRAEKALADSIAAQVSEAHRHQVHIITDASIMGSAAAIQLSQACIGNDTGMVNVAAAVERPTLVLLGPRPLLDHDPLLTSLTAPTLSAVTVDMVMSALAARLQEPSVAEPVRGHNATASSTT